METKFSNVIKSTPAGSLLVGTMSNNDKEGEAHISAAIQGTPAGFRMLAHFLEAMADSVESGQAKDKGWGLYLSPEDIAALQTLEVEGLSLFCKPG